MADPALLIKLHQRARSTILPTVPPEDLLARAAHLGVVTHDAYIAGRIARAYFAWAQADACLQTISQQAKSHAPNIPLPFSNDTWSNSWVAVHQSHQGQRFKIDEIEARLDPIDVQDADDWDIDIYAPDQPRPPQLDTELPADDSPSELPGSAVMPTELPTAANDGPAQPCIRISDPVEDEVEYVPAAELEPARLQFPTAVEKLQGNQLAAIWATWQTVAPPPELLSFDDAAADTHPELITIIHHAKEQIEGMFGSYKPETTSKGKGKATIEWDPGLGSSRDVDLDRIPSASPPSVFSNDGRLSIQSRTSVESGINSVLTAGSRESEPELGKKSRFSKLKRPLNKLVRRGTKQSDNKGKRVSIMSTAIVMRECSSCFEDIPDAVGLACQHSYCRQCFASMVLAASSNEAQWPPRCCMIDIPRNLIAVGLSPEQLSTYHAKEQEYSIKASERWYCSNVPACGKFFTPKVKGQDSTTCTHCKHKMCTFCRGPAHARGQRCTQDTNLQAMMQEAELEGWRQCIGCSTMVELNTGCRHITCRCGSEFCYTCGAVWRTCNCTERDQERRNQEIRTRREEARRLEREREAAERRAREVRDREAEELEEALAAIQRQQEADLAARQLAEEEEAQMLEEHRLLTIEVVFEELKRLLDQIVLSQLDSIKLRFAKEESCFTHLETSFHAAAQWELQNLEDLKGKHEAEVVQVQQRHERDMSAFKKKIEKYILKRAMEVEDEYGEDISPLDRIMEMREHTTASYEALETIQQEELALLKQSHKRIHDSSSKQHKQIEKALLREFDTNNSSSNGVEGNMDDDESALAELIMSLDERKTEHARATLNAFKWWECMSGLCVAALADRKARLISTGADAPEVPGVVIPELVPKPLVEEPPSMDAEANDDPYEGSSTPMPGSFPSAPPGRAPPPPPPETKAKVKAKVPTRSAEGGVLPLGDSLEDLIQKTTRIPQTRTPVPPLGDSLEDLIQKTARIPQTRKPVPPPKLGVTRQEQQQPAPVEPEWPLTRPGQYPDPQASRQRRLFDAGSFLGRGRPIPRGFDPA